MGAAVDICLQALCWIQEHSFQTIHAHPRALTQMPVPAGGGGGGGELANDGLEIERQDFSLNFFRSRVSVLNASSLPLRFRLWLLLGKSRSFQLLFKFQGLS